MSTNASSVEVTGLRSRHGAHPPTDKDKRAAVLDLLEALGRGDDLEVIVENARLRHRKNDTFPGEVFLDVARDALDLAARRAASRSTSAA